jgi:NTP pyrophosphatase (non-canonical NTP hydrolase)
MGYMTDGITFNVLRDANRNRQKEWPGNEKADVAFRAIELAGEAGEVSEAVKKYLRAARGIKGSTATQVEIADEMGDLLVSLDLLADALGIDLGAAVRAKFNATSEKYGMRTYLGDSDWHLRPAPTR